MARRSINDAAKVFLAAFVLGPPIGGVVVFLLLQLLRLWRWPEKFVDVVAQFPSDFLRALPMSMQLSYVAGVLPAGLAGLALAAYFGWGGRITWWACLAASLIFPLLLAVGSLVRPLAPGLPIFLGLPSAVSALVCYLLLRNTKLVKASGDRPQGISP